MKHKYYYFTLGLKSETKGAVFHFYQVKRTDKVAKAPLPPA
jgi:hypothetical protein